MKIKFSIFLIIFFLSFNVNAEQKESGLPLCPEDDPDRMDSYKLKWDNCFGIGESQHGKYEGEFHNGVLHGNATFNYYSGDVYIGEYVEGRIEGQGSYYMENGDKYEGTFRDYSFDGVGKYTYSDGRVEEGIWENSQLVENKRTNKIIPVEKKDVGTSETKDETICVAKNSKDYLTKWDARNGVILSYGDGQSAVKAFTGKHLCKDENGKIRSLGYYKIGLRDGKFNAWYENGQKKVEVNFKDGRQNGKATGWYENGQKHAESNFKDGERHGKRTEWNENGQIKEEKYYASGSIVTKEYFDSIIPEEKRVEFIEKSDGAFTNISYYENGQIRTETNYNKHRKKDGKVTEWYANGQMERKEYYIDDKKDGKFTYWFENGQKRSEGHWKQNVEVRVESKHYKDGKWTEWYENGQIKSEENYKDDKKDGKWTEWYENGQIKAEESYKIDGKFGMKDGKFTEWNENGQKMYEGNYKNGKQDGKFTTWREDGRIFDVKNYANGNRISWYKDGECIEGDC